MLHSQRSRHFIDCFPPNFKLFTTTIQTQIQPPNPNLISSLLHLCNNQHHLQQIHARFIIHGLHQNQSLCSTLINSYSNLGFPKISQHIFNSISNPNASLYNSFLRNLYNLGEFENTLLVYQEMVSKLMYPDEYTYPFVLDSCSQLSDIENGKKIHGFILKLGFDSYDLVGGALQEMYKGHKVIDKMPVNNLLRWNLLIFEACRNGDPEEGFRIFKRMRVERVDPDSIGVINLLRASVDLNSFRVGRPIHGLIVMRNLCEDLDVNTALLTMYSKLNGLEDARLLFDRILDKDCVVWNLMISAYSRHGYPEKSLELLMSMVRSRIRDDLFTAIAAISSISDLKSLVRGKEIHAHVTRNGSDYQVSVHNALIEMYCKCDCLEAARKIFDMVTNKTVVSWSSMIKGYVNREMFYDALSLFTHMKLDGYGVDSIIVINILPACVNIGALEKVKYLHGLSIKYGLNLISSVNTAILISYSKCGCLEMARKLFDEEEINSKDIVAWNSIISAYAKYGDTFQCFDLYGQMKKSKLKPDHVTFLGLLTACVNSGSVKEGRDFFEEMTEMYKYQPNQEHYACMVDLLGRTGHFEEASEIINSMPFKPDARVWGPLLSACKMHSKTKLGELAAERLISMEPKNAGNYVLLSNIYAAAGKWDGVAKMRSFLRDRGLKKTPGCSWLEINGRVHEFRVADRSHPKSASIYTILGNLELEIKQVRYKISQNQL